MPRCRLCSALLAAAILTQAPALAAVPAAPQTAGGAALERVEAAPQLHAARPPSLPGLDLARARVVDLTHSYGADTLYWPSSPPEQFRLQVVHDGPTPGGFYYASNTLCTPEHGGTHLDAPVHFGEGKWTTAEVPVERLVARAAVIDASAQAAADPDYRLTRADVLAWEERHGRVPEGAVVLLRTGWSERWPDRQRYFGSPSREDASALHFPSFGADAAALLVERGVVALGVDTASIDHGQSRDFMVHRITAAANVPGLENLTRLGELPATGAWIVALPMKIEGGSGGPLRAIALIAD
jgi:kynurenine formamidase